MSNSLLEPYINEIAGLLSQACAQNGGKLPELHRIAWHAFLSCGVVDHVDYETVRKFFPDFSTDPDCDDPVLAMAMGKHYFDHDPSIPEGECLYETEFEGLSRKIGQDKKHFGGNLPPGYTVAWSGKLLGLHDCKEITDHEYDQLKAMLPDLEDSPIVELERITRKYVSPGKT